MLTRLHSCGRSECNAGEQKLPYMYQGQEALYQRHHVD